MRELSLKMVLITGNRTELVNFENPHPDNNALLKEHVLANFSDYCDTCNYIIHIDNYQWSYL